MSNRQAWLLWLATVALCAGWVVLFMGGVQIFDRKYTKHLIPVSAEWQRLYDDRAESQIAYNIAHHTAVLKQHKDGIEALMKRVSSLEKAASIDQMTGVIDPNAG